VWQEANQGRAAAVIRRQRRKQQEKLRKKASAAFHLRRVTAQVKGASLGTERVRVLVNEVCPHGLEAFASRYLPAGHEIELTIDSPGMVLFVKARIVFSEHFNSSHRVISREAYPYRVGMLFLFQSDQEEVEVRAYFQRAAA
jgi:hypothetical protein